MSVYVNIVFTDSDGVIQRSHSATTTPSGSNFEAVRISVGTTEETHTINTEVGNAKQLMIVNHDDTNFVEVGTATGVYFARVLPGEANLLSIPPTTATLYLKADTAAVTTELIIREA